MLTTGDRVSLVLRITDHLKREYDWDRIGFILSSFGIAMSDNDPLEQDTASATDEQLIELAVMLGLDAPASAPTVTTSATSTGARPLFIFGSHLSKHKTLVGDVGRELARYGITLFVAHDTITHDSDWEDEIRKALDRAHAGLVFVHTGLRESSWCDQEIGWLHGRHVPVMALRFDLTPYGFFARLQAQPVPAEADAALIAEMTLDRIASKPELTRQFAASLVSSLDNSQSYKQTNDIWARLSSLVSLDAELCLRLFDAVKCNRQVYDAWSRGDSRGYPRVVLEFVEKQPGAEQIRDEIDRYIAYLNEPDTLAKQKQQMAFDRERQARHPLL